HEVGLWRVNGFKRHEGASSNMLDNRGYNTDDARAKK
ncbi:MAG: hypothetical protein ACJA1J_003822, partial [Sulfitobacter pontiacus]